MTCRRQRRFSGCKDVAYDMLKAVACQRVQGGRVRRVRRNLPGVCGCKDVPPPLSLRGAERRDNPFSLRQRITKSNTLSKYGKCYEFAKTAASLPGPSAGTRIAAPVCALVRNDMQKTGTCSRVQGRPPIVIARSGATGQSVLLAAAHNKEQYFKQIRKVLRICQNSSQLARPLCGDADCRTSVRTGSQ